LRTAWDTLLAPLFKKSGFCLYRFRYILTKLSPYKKFMLKKEKFIPQSDALRVLCKGYKLQVTSLRVSGYT